MLHSKTTLISKNLDKCNIQTSHGQKFNKNGGHEKARHSSAIYHRIGESLGAEQGRGQ